MTPKQNLVPEKDYFVSIGLSELKKFEHYWH